MARRPGERAGKAEPVVRLAVEAATVERPGVLCRLRDRAPPPPPLPTDAAEEGCELLLRVDDADLDRSRARCACAATAAALAFAAAADAAAEVEGEEEGPLRCDEADRPREAEEAAEVLRGAEVARNEPLVVVDLPRVFEAP